MRSSTVLSGIILLLSGNLSAAEVLTLDGYIVEVKKENGAYKAAGDLAEGAKMRAEETKLTTAPVAFASMQYSYDQRPTVTPAFQGTLTKGTNYSLGLRMNSTIGLQSSLYYSIVETQIVGASPSLLPLSHFYDTRPTIELTQSLWRNFFGSETRATIRAAESGALAQSYSNRYTQKVAVAQSEVAYYRLAIAREAVLVQKESYERSKKIRDWILKQVNMNLADRSDLHQAEAALKVKDLELQAAVDEEVQASLNFNLQRGVNKQTVSEALVLPKKKELSDLDLPKRSVRRDDTLAATEQLKSVQANAEAGLSRVRPTLELYGSFSLNGRDSELGASSSESFTTQHPYGVVGLRISSPLNFPVTFETRDGYRKEVIGAETQVTRKELEEDQQWTGLLNQFTQAKNKLTLAYNLEEAQGEKLNFERDRHRRGRTTTFQVLQFEQDYATAQLGRLKQSFDLLQTHSQLKTFMETL